MCGQWCSSSALPRRSRIVRGLSGPLTYTLVISTLLSIYETALASHTLPAGFTCGQPGALTAGIPRSWRAGISRHNLFKSSRCTAPRHASEVASLHQRRFKTRRCNVNRSQAWCVMSTCTAPAGSCAQCRSLSVTASEPFNLSSFALSLLLVFRTNSSYSRWLDARKIWGGVVNRSRDLVRQVSKMRCRAPTAGLAWH